MGSTSPRNPFGVANLKQSGPFGVIARPGKPSGDNPALGVACGIAPERHGTTVIAGETSLTAAKLPQSNERLGAKHG